MAVLVGCAGRIVGHGCEHVISRQGTPDTLQRKLANRIDCDGALNVLQSRCSARNHGRLLAPVNAYHAQRGGISYDQRWNNTAALTTLRTGKGVRYLWR